MNPRNYDRILLGLLAEQETTIARIYQRYAERFPEHRSFWLALSQDEWNHAKWIDALALAIERGRVRTDPDHLKLEELGKFTKYLKERLEELEGVDLRAPQAFRHAATIESGLLEEPFKKIFISSDPKATLLLDKLVEQTKRHSERIAEMVKRIGPETRPDGIRPRK